MKTRLFTLLLAIIVCTGTIWASDTSVDGIWYNFDSSTLTAEVTYHGSSYSEYSNEYAGTVTIPSSVNYSGNIYCVTNIGVEAFRKCTSLTSVTIPNSVTSIGELAFGFCTGLTSVTIPNSVTNIGSYAFSGCHSLTSVTIPNSVTSIGFGAFSYCTGLTSVTIPNSVTSIETEVFDGCTGLTSIDVSPNNPNYCSIDGVLFNKDKTILVRYPPGKQGAYAIPNSVTSIRYSAFYYCQGLTSVTIPNSVTSIGNEAFRSCFGLTSVTIPNSVTSIGEWAFSSCSGLTSVTIPNSVTSIGEWAFYYCTILSDIYVTCGDLDRVRQMLGNDSRVKYPPLPYSVSANAENGSVSFPQTICDALELVAIPSNGYHFTQWSDGNTENPRTIFLTQDTTFTAEFAADKSGNCGDNLALRWEYDDNSKSLTISGSGTLNSNYTFGVEAPNAVEKLVIAEGVTSIGNSAFAEYSTLKHLSVAASVKTIHEQAFYNCTGLEEIYCYRATPPTAYSNTFDGIEKFECVLHVLSASVNMYKAATGWRDFYYVQTIDAVEVTDLITDVTVVPTDNTAEVTWPAVEQAATYTIVISKDGVVFCTLIFNANGQLQGIAFAPSRSDHHHAPAAVKTSNGGLRFTVTGLDSGTNYHLTLNTKDSDDQVIASYTSNFTTSGVARGIEDVKQNVQATKILRNGQILILRGDRTYTVTGQELR